MMKIDAIATQFPPDQAKLLYDKEQAQVEQLNWHPQAEFVAKLEHQILSLIQQVYAGGECAAARALAHMYLDPDIDLVPAARLIVTKALGDPQHCEAYAILSRALHSYFPALPPIEKGEKAESFMHAVLDAFQMEFEDLLMHPASMPKDMSTCESHAKQMDPSSKMRAAVQFAGYLHHQGLLGTRVVSHMVHDLVGAGAIGFARELLGLIGVAVDNPERGNLEPVLEVPTDGEASSADLSCEPEPEHSESDKPL